MAGVREIRLGRKPTAIVGLKVRLREPLRKKLEVAAKKKGVSLNAELVARLERSFEAEPLEEITRRLEGVSKGVDWDRIMEIWEKGRRK
jgi:Arc-like DNA binding domain